VALRFVVARSVERADTPAALERFAAQLGYAIREEVSAEVVPSYGALREALDGGRAQLAWVPPILLVDATAAERLVPLAKSMRDGASEYCAVLFALKSSKVRELGDLRGTTVAWVDRCSAAGYLLPQLHLVAEGFNPAKLFGRELFFGSHGDVVRAVFDGRADVGATFGGAPDAADPDAGSGFARVELEDRKPVHVLFRSSPVSSDAVVCEAKLPSVMRARVTAALVHMGTFAVGRHVTRAVFGADGFRPFDGAALEPLRELVEGARARGWLIP
jgi:phosphonate transport system substrate-binding protein